MEMKMANEQFKPLSINTQCRLVAALALAESEIHNPGAGRHIGIDLIALIEGVLAEADPKRVAYRAVREELLKAHSFAA